MVELYQNMERFDRNMERFDRNIMVIVEGLAVGRPELDRKCFNRMAV